jgi:protein-S-isoprenylcysteine O-methyltransferase Ste14
MSDLLALMTIMAWPIVPLFWIPVHFATDYFRRFGLVSYIMPVITWLPLAYLIYREKGFLLLDKIDMPSALNAVGIPLFISGILLHIWTAKLLGIGGIIGIPEISDKAAEKLVAEGPFSIVRHPTYLAHTLIFSGVFLITETATVGIVAILDFIVVNAVIIPLEEKELSERFGDDYVSYRKKVPSRFFPWPHKKENQN